MKTYFGVKLGQVSPDDSWTEDFPVTIVPIRNDWKYFTFFKV